MSTKIIRKCEYCGKEFETYASSHGKRFCNQSCSAYWRNKTFGPNLISEETKLKNAELLRNKWKNEDFRNANIYRMKTNNPVYMQGVVEKANKTRKANGKLHNNFKYGNGVMSEYEKKVIILTTLGFKYNYAIPTKTVRDTFPDRHFPNSYKPDFVNLEQHLCIEIDGNNHQRKHIQELDAKKDFCLNQLGFEVIRFTHKDIDEGVFEKWLNLYVKEQQK